MGRWVDLFDFGPVRLLRPVDCLLAASGKGVALELQKQSHLIDCGRLAEGNLFAPAVDD